MKNSSLHRPAGVFAAAFLLSSLFCINRLQAQGSATYAFNPLAGQGVVLDHIDGTGTNARFISPVAVAFDTSGNAYVADAGDHTVRMVTVGGTVTTIAGSSGVAGSSNGVGAGALFTYPSGIALDGSGNIYVSDSGTNTIRKIGAGASVSTLAGSGAAGNSDGAAGSAQFNGPQGIAVDAVGNVYVVDTNNSTVRKISTSGTVSTLAGSAGQTGSADGAGGSARFNYPTGLAIDGAGNLYVADFDNSTIRKVTAAGAVSTLAGNPTQTGLTNGTGGAALFNHPEAVAADAGGNVYVADTSNHQIRKIAVGGIVTTLAGSGTGLSGNSNGSGPLASFDYPGGIAVNAGGTLAVADTGNHLVRSVTAAGAASTLAGAVGMAGTSGFAYPDGVAVDGSGNVYVADRNNNVIRKVSPGGGVSVLAGTAGTLGSADGTGTAATFNAPSGVAVDTHGNVYVADTGNSTIRLINAAGIVSTLAGTAGQSGSGNGNGNAARFNQPQGVAVDSAGNVWVADTGNSTIRQIAPGGAVTTSAGTPGQPGSADGAGAGALFNSPNALAVDNQGSVYISDLGNYTIRKMSATTGVVTTLAGSPGKPGDVDSNGSNARFNQTYGLAVDASGNLYAADSNNHTLRQISTTTGAVATVGGTETVFMYPEGLAIDSGGNLYVSDADNQEILKGAPLFPPPVLTAPTNQTVAAGGSATFTVSANISSTFQWQISTNGGASWTILTDSGTYSGSTSGTLTVNGVTAAMNGYEYRAAGTASGNATADSAAATLYVGGSHLANLSTRAFVGTGAQALFAGFVINGSGSKRILLRGVGPTLATYGVTGFLAQPTLTLSANGSTIATNTVWGGSTTISSVFGQVGAFPLPASSADSCILQPVAVGAYSSEVSGVGTQTGIALDEIYDADTGATTSNLVNISSRAFVGTGANILDAGFIIEGTAPLTVLVRGVGPGLATFGLTGLLTTPQLTVYDSNATPIATNIGWGSASTLGSSGVQTTIAPATSATFTAAGAFSLAPGSADCAMIVTLPPGSYSAELVGANGTTGIGMVEIYLLP